MAKKSSKPSSQEIRRQITDQMIASLKNEVVPWRKPWSSSEASGMPANFHSKRRYNGINTLILMLSNLTCGYKSKYWGTASAWKKHCGVYVKKGEKATYVTLFNMVGKKENGKPVLNKQGQDVLIPLMRYFPVFNVEQLNISKKEDAEAVAKYLVLCETRNEDPNFAPAEELIAATGAKIIEEGDRAVYNRLDDTITVPNRRSFDTISNFYETVFHELVHQACTQMNWSGKYSMGELIAEMGACFLMTELQVPMHEKMLVNSQSYIASWLQEMSDDPKFVFEAATQASKAVDRILGFIGKNNPEFHDPDDLLESNKAA